MAKYTDISKCWWPVGAMWHNNPYGTYFVWCYAEARRILDVRGGKKGWCKVAHMWKLHDAGSHVELRWTSLPGEVFAKITPDDVLTFALPTKLYNRNHASISQTIQQCLPIYSSRRDVHDKRVMHSGEAYSYGGFPYPWDVFRRVQTKGYRYERGIQFDLKTGMCLNPPKDYVIETDPAQRKEWLAVMRNYRKNLKIMRRLGLVEKAVQMYREEGRGWRATYADREDHVAKLLSIMQKDSLHMKDLNYILVTSNLSWWRPQDWHHALSNMPKNHSRELRQAFGALRAREK